MRYSSLKVEAEDCFHTVYSLPRLMQTEAEKAGEHLAAGMFNVKQWVCWEHSMGIWTAEPQKEKLCSPKQRTCQGKKFQAAISIQGTCKVVSD